MSKTLDKISKLLNKAENAGTPEEAEAFMAKVQELASINGVDLAVARMHQAKKERHEPIERRVQVNPYSRRHNRKHFTELAMAIADVNDVKYTIGEYALHCTGFPEDIDVVEALYTHLAVQMATECDDALKRGEHKEERWVPVTTKVEIPWEDRLWGAWNGKQYYDDNPEDGVYSENPKVLQEAREEYLDAVKKGEEIWSDYTRNYQGGYRKPVPPPAYREEPVMEIGEDGVARQKLERKVVSAIDGRVFRNDFYGAFVRRMRGRLWEVRKAVEREQGVEEASSETAVALLDKREVVEKAYEERIKVMHLGVYEPSYEADRKRDHSGRGSRAGNEAAVRVPINDKREVDG